MYSQENIESLFQRLGRHQDCKIVENPLYCSIKTKNSIWPNQLYNINPTNIDEDVKEIEEAIKHEYISHFFMSNPASLDQKVVKKLRKKNYARAYWTAMTYDLNVPISHMLPKELTIHQVNSLSELEKWLMVSEIALMGNKALNHNIFLPLLEDPNVLFYTGKMYSEIVGTAMLYQTEHIGGVYFVSTLAEHRNKGIGKSLTTHCLLEAQKRNIQKVCIQATQLGEPLYTKLGFQNNGSIELFKIGEYA